MYASEINSLLALTKAEHKAIANLATAVLSLVNTMDDARSPAAPSPTDTRNRPGARLILDRLERKAHGRV
jgi:hypothetical protein